MTREQASQARDAFVISFQKDHATAIKLIADRDAVIWNTSTTKVRGVTPHIDGGYLVRCTIAGVRYYVGYFKTIEEGEDARCAFIKSKTC